MHIKDYIKHLLLEDLPGIEAQRLMAPRLTNPTNKPVILEDVPDDVRRNAVLLCLTGDRFDDLEFVLTLRSSNLIKHAGQLSLPGGGVEAGELPHQAALRETREEVGITLQDSQIIGNLTPIFIPHSYNFIHTFIAWKPEKSQFVLQVEEVEEAFYVQVRDLIHPNKIVTEMWNLRDQDMEVPYWQVHSVPLWGATAMIMSEFVEIMKKGLKTHKII